MAPPVMVSQKTTSERRGLKKCRNRECSARAGQEGKPRSPYCSKRCQAREQNMRQGRIKGHGRRPPLLDILERQRQSVTEAELEAMLQSKLDVVEFSDAIAEHLSLCVLNGRPILVDLTNGTDGLAEVKNSLPREAVRIAGPQFTGLPASVPERRFAEQDARHRLQHSELGGNGVRAEGGDRIRRHPMRATYLSNRPGLGAFLKGAYLSGPQARPAGVHPIMSGYSAASFHAVPGERTYGVGVTSPIGNGMPSPAGGSMVNRSPRFGGMGGGAGARRPVNSGGGRFEMIPHGIVGAPVGHAGNAGGLLLEREGDGEMVAFESTRVAPRPAEASQTGKSCAGETSASKKDTDSVQAPPLLPKIAPSNATHYGPSVQLMYS
mmetsp:Transcript_7602/g.21607  ORF Transcript_7602/g.21607 Transcript_7602/m.21607 type:complete len:379 (-) Transcript_7602:25-1161(-)